MELTIPEDDETTPTLEVVYQKLRDIDRKHVSGHNNRSRILLEIGERLDEISAAQSRIGREVTENTVRLKEFENRKVEISNIRFTPSIFFAGLVLCASIFGGQAWFMAPVYNKMEVIDVKIEAIKDQRNSDVKLQDERASRWNNDIAQVKAGVNMVDTKVGNVMINQAAANGLRR